MAIESVKRTEPYNPNLRGRPARPVVISGITYASIRLAARTLRIAKKTIYKKLATGEIRSA